MVPAHVLLIDHDETRGQALAALLRAGGHIAVSEPIAAAAAAALVATPGQAAPGFDLLLLDLALPGLDLAALRAVVAPDGTAPQDALAAAERRHIVRMLEHTGGNRRRAAQLLGISRSTLLSKIRKYGI